MKNEEKEIEHELMESEPKYKWFGRKIRDFVKGYVNIPEIPMRGKENFDIFDQQGIKYIASLDSQGRIWCKEWYHNNPVKSGDKIIVNVENQKIIIYPAHEKRIKTTSQIKSNEPQLVTLLRATQRSSDNPIMFEKAIVEAFNYMGFNAKHIGGRDEPDILIEDYRIILDGKSTKEGNITSETAIGFERLERYKEKYNIKFIGVVAPGFSEGYIRETSKKRGIILIETEAVCKLLQNNTVYPYEPHRIIEILFDSGKEIITPKNIPLSTVDQEMLIEIIAKILSDIKLTGKTSFTIQELHNVYSWQNLNYSRDEIENALNFLSTTPFCILKKQNNDYHLNSEIDALLKKIGLMIQAFTKIQR